jgi:hypothetical protein
VDLARLHISGVARHLSRRINDRTPSRNSPESARSASEITMAAVNGGVLLRRSKRPIHFSL